MRRLLLALALLALPCAARAQELGCDAGDREIRRVSFEGNTHFRDGELGDAIVTTPSSWWRRVLRLPLGARHCLDTLEVQRDAVRLRLFYRQRGYYETTVATDVSPTDPGGVAVAFRITEGRPVIIDSLVVTGLDSLPPRLEERLMRVFTPFRNGIYDKIRLQSAIDTAVSRLQNNGYAYAAEPLRDISVDNATDRATVALTFLPGPRAYIGRIMVQVAPNQAGQPPAIDTGTVHELLSFRTGELYRRRDLLRTQRDLYGLETYRHVAVGLLPDSLQTSDTSLAVLVRVDEAQMKSMRVGLGWATLDCVRTQARFTDRNFLGGARRLELSGRLSHIGLCPQNVRDDQFSDQLNYFVSATLRLPALFGPRNIPSLSIFSERTSEFQTYIRHTPIGGAAQVTRDLRPRDLRPGLPLTLGYSIEYGRTEAGPAVFCQIFGRCSLSDIERLEQNTSLRVVSLALSRDRTDNLLYPSRGSQVRLELRSGATSADTGGATRFNRVFAEASVYHPIGRGSVVAARLQLGAVLEAWSLRGATHFVPPQERLYAGGPNSVRGYNQNLLGPIVYIVSPDSTSVRDTVVAGDTIPVASPNAAVQQYSPTGGNSLIVGNLEWRFRSPFLGDVLQLATFVDAGLVWNRPAEALRLDDLRVTPGVGVRVNSPVGPFRVDVAYNRYPLSSGAAYVIDRTQDALRCVSPGAGGDASGADGACPTTFTPARRSSLFSRLTFNFSIGQAF